VRVEVEIRDNRIVRGVDGDRPRNSVWWQSYDVDTEDHDVARQVAVARAMERWPEATGYTVRT
jgi:hypothetical protein